MTFLHKPAFLIGDTRSSRPPTRPWAWRMPANLVCIASFHLVLFIVIIQTVFASEEGNKGKGYLEIGGGLATGDFGTSTRSDLYYVGPTLGYVSRSWDASVTVPYLFLSNGTTSQSSGIGDVILRGDGIFVPEGRTGFSLDAGLALKIPTTNGTNGLGTGKADFGAFAAIHQRIGAIRVSLFGGYVKVGSSSSGAYQDTPMYGVGLSGNWGRTSISASFEERRSIFPGQPSPHEVSLDLFRPLSRKLAIKERTFFGLNKGGPDFGLSAAIVCWF